MKDNRFETPNPHNISFTYKTGAKDKEGSIVKLPKNNVLEEIDIVKTQVIHNTTDKTRNKKR